MSGPSGGRNTGRWVVVRVPGEFSPRRFPRTFVIGAGESCDLRVSQHSVDAEHVQLVHDGLRWWVRDLGAPGGTILDGREVNFAPLPERARLQLGSEGPVLEIAQEDSGLEGEDPGEPSHEDEEPEAAPVRRSPTRNSAPARGPRTTESRTPRKTASQAPPARGEDAPLGVTQLIQRYSRDDGAPAGRQTQMIRAAVARMKKGHSRRYRWIIAVAAVALLASGGGLIWQFQRLEQLRSSAETLYYSMRTAQIEAARLEDRLAGSTDPSVKADIEGGRHRIQEMEAQYGKFVQELGIYADLDEQERVIVRMARVFGECEVNVPRPFLREVKKYIHSWKTKDKLLEALKRATDRGVASRITEAFVGVGLPPQYVYMAQQESGFDDRAVGPNTRFGYAKGMWQFISYTGQKYGLRVGPLFAQAVYDPRDDRFAWEKATVAAARYIRDMTDNEAEGSMMLVMAGYNWNEDKVHDLINQMPNNPRERNFWKLLEAHKVPQETYDYVLSIFSMSVICEDPKLFGFDLKCPTHKLASAPGEGPGGG